MRTPLLALTAALALLPALGACGDDTVRTDGEARPVVTERLSEDEGTTLVYSMENRWGEVPKMVAQLHLVEALQERLAALGQERAAVTVGSAGELRVTVTEDAVEEAATAIEQHVEVRFRIRAPSEIENAEREKRAELGEFDAGPRDDFAWFALPDGQEILLYVPEAPRIRELEELRSAESPDEAAITEKMTALSRLLLQKVFTESDLSNAEAIHRPGDSSVRLTIRPERRDAFREMTSNYLTRQMAVLVNGRVVAAPTLTEPLTSAAEIRGPAGTYRPNEADVLAAAFRRAAYGIRLARTR